jgi:hypothetical protein
MAESIVQAYGRCPCGGHYQPRIVEVRMQVGGRPVLLEEIPQGACLNCGSRVYKAGILELVDSVLKGETLDRRCNEPPL